MHKSKAGETAGMILGSAVLLFIVASLVLGGFLVTTFITGNFWFSEDGVLRELKISHPRVTEVVKTERNIFSYSVITAKEDSVFSDYLLDTNVLWNYKFPKEK